MQRRVAAPQRPSVYAVSELSTGLESLCSPWTCSQHEAEMKHASLLHSVEQNNIYFKKQFSGNSTEFENHM